MRKNLVKLFAIMCIVSLALVACGDDKKDSDKKSMTTTTDSTETTADKSDATMTIAEIAASNANFSKLASFANTAGLVDLLGGEGSYTIFAPSNDVFDKVDSGVLASLAANKDALTQALRYHAIIGEEPLTDGKELITAEGSKLTVGVKDGKTTITTDNGVTVNVVGDPIAATNGVVYVIDGVLLPKDLAL